MSISKLRTLDTPRRVTDAYEEYFSGYRLDPSEALSRTFDETGGYDDLVYLDGLVVESCGDWPARHGARYCRQLCLKVNLDTIAS